MVFYRLISHLNFLEYSVYVRNIISAQEYHLKYLKSMKCDNIMNYCICMLDNLSYSISTCQQVQKLTAGTPYPHFLNSLKKDDIL